MHPTALRLNRIPWLGVCLLVTGLSAGGPAEIPLPEHPRPDFERAEWINLNGPWAFQFDPGNVGESEHWATGAVSFAQRILVPFPWGSKLSGVADEGDIGWYARSMVVPEAWKGQRVRLVLGASDWLTTAWLDGQPLGTNRGGYTPAEFDLTSAVKFGQEQRLVLRVDDRRHPFKLEGKQGYGPARGLWQTAYLEPRPLDALEQVHFLPDIDAGTVTVRGRLVTPASTNLELAIEFKTAELPNHLQAIPAGAREVEFTLSIPKARWWSLNDPFLYEVDAVLQGGTGGDDRVSTYFGMRKVSVAQLPGLGFPYIALNHQPVYLQMALDQAYHRDGFYTWPNDAFMRDEILRSKRLGLNANRIHVKIDLPRKLYWADKLGLLLMCDVPNSWTQQPDLEMRRETETALRGMIDRDFNHPAIFSWVIFNETWGLTTGPEKVFTPETQDWVAGMFRLAKELDPSRLVEDNSPCHNDHVVTDINSWHRYLAGFEWLAELDAVVSNTVPGSAWNFIGGRTQGAQPLLNSECGNVWGYDQSTGDVDWSWDYHIMMNEFRRHPKVCGWLYTEHHDVINEWNGYYRFDRSEKATGLDGVFPGMHLRDLHAPFYLSTGSELCRTVSQGDKIRVPLYASFMTATAPAPQLILRAELFGWDNLGRRETYARFTRPIAFEPWLSRELKPLEVGLPRKPALAVLGLTLEDGSGTVLQRNFTTFLVADGPSPRDEMQRADDQDLRIVRFAPTTFTEARWSSKQWNVLDGLKVNGAGHGYFEYHVPWPADVSPRRVLGATLRFEASAKQLFGKDHSASRQEGDFMLGKGTLDPGLNPNSYPMTDDTRFPTSVRVRVAGDAVASFDLPDDPADHRGILSWNSQPRDRKLHEAGSYGYLCTAALPADTLRKAAAQGVLVIRLEVDPGLPGGLALYGERFGRYPLDPTLVFTLKR